MTFLEALARLPPSITLTDGGMTWTIERLTEAAKVIPDSFDYALVTNKDGRVELVATTSTEVRTMYWQVPSA